MWPTTLLSPVTETDILVFTLFEATSSFFKLTEADTLALTLASDAKPDFTLALVATVVLVHWEFYASTLDALTGTLLKLYLGCPVT